MNLMIQCVEPRPLITFSHPDNIKEYVDSSVKDTNSKYSQRLNEGIEQLEIQNSLTRNMEFVRELYVSMINQINYRVSHGEQIQCGDLLDPTVFAMWCSSFSDVIDLNNCRKTKARDFVVDPYLLDPLKHGLCYNTTNCIISPVGLYTDNYTGRTYQYSISSYLKNWNVYDCIKDCGAREKSYLGNPFMALDHAMGDYRLHMKPFNHYTIKNKVLCDYICTLNEILNRRIYKTFQLLLGSNSGGKNFYVTHTANNWRDVCPVLPKYKRIADALSCLIYDAVDFNRNKVSSKMDILNSFYNVEEYLAELYVFVDLDNELIKKILH